MAGIDNTDIKMDSVEHLDQVMLKACHQHLDIMDAQLLDFDVKWAEFEIANLAHETARKEMTQMSSKISSFSKYSTAPSE